MFCKYVGFSNRYINHLVTHHKEDLAVEKYRLSLQNGVKKGMMIPLFIKMEGGSEEIYRVCFGCNKFWGKITLCNKHIEDCDNSLKHKEICKSLLPINQIVENTETNTQSDTAIKALQEQIKKLEKQVQRLEREKKVAEEGDFKYDKLQSALRQIADDDYRDQVINVLNNNKEEDDEFDINWEEEI
jgi:hypothetical protein